MGMKPRACSICGAKGKENLCNGTGVLSGFSLVRACDLYEINLEDHVDDITAVTNVAELSIACPLSEEEDEEEDSAWN